MGKKISGKMVERVFRKLDVEYSYLNSHIRGFLVDDGLKLYPPLYTTTGSGELPSRVVEKLRKNLLLSIPEFERLISCEMPREEYFEIRRSRGSANLIVKNQNEIFAPTCFISYSGYDEEFADKLTTDLNEAGIQSWFAPHNLGIGDDIKESIIYEIENRKTVVLILSKHSIDSEWVGIEVNKAFQLEHDSGDKVLFPIRIDDAVFDPGAGWYKSISRKYIGDFRYWDDEVQYMKEFGSLINAIQNRKS